MLLLRKNGFQGAERLLYRIGARVIAHGADAPDAAAQRTERSADLDAVLLALAALENVLRREGWKAEAGAGVEAALAHYSVSGAAAGAAGGLEVDDSLGAGGIGRI